MAERASKSFPSVRFTAMATETNLEDRSCSHAALFKSHDRNRHCQHELIVLQHEFHISAECHMSPMPPLHGAAREAMTSGAQNCRLQRDPELSPQCHDAMRDPSARPGRGKPLIHLQASR